VAILENLPATNQPDTSAARDRNVKTVQRFFEYFQRDRERFFALWAPNPTVELPFAPPGLAKRYATASEFAAFWDPIFLSFKGKFDWIPMEMIVGENPDKIVTVMKSDIDLQTPSGPLKHQGDYIQVFTLTEGKIVRFVEYVDSWFMRGFSDFEE